MTDQMGTDGNVEKHRTGSAINVASACAKQAGSKRAIWQLNKFSSAHTGGHRKLINVKLDDSSE